MPDVTAVIAEGNVLLAALVAVLAGLISFASPCVLPLVPGYLGYVTGLTGVPLEQQRRGRVVLGSVLFVLGFTVVFMVMVLLASVLGAGLRAHQDVLAKVGGVLVIALGVVFLGGVTTVAWQSTWRPAAGLVGAPLLGAVFALGWMPCTGPTLGTIMALASNFAGDGNLVARGAVLGAAYCGGLGLPFILLAAGWSRAQRASAWVRRHYRAVQSFGGVFLIVIGLLLVTGAWEQLVQRLQGGLVGGFVTVI